MWHISYYVYGNTEPISNTLEPIQPYPNDMKYQKALLQQERIPGCPSRNLYSTGLNQNLLTE